MKTYLVYNNDEQGFFESEWFGTIHYTHDIDSACHYSSMADARACADNLDDNCVILEWKD